MPTKISIPPHELSKSTFIRGCQCSKSLWLHKHARHLRDELSEAQQAIFSRGNEVGALARELFPGGVDASPADPFHFQQSVADTQAFIAAGKKIIYEAAFQYNGVLAAIDILVNKNGKWYAYEVKSTTSVKATFIKDAALQYYVITQSGIDLQDIFIVHLNNGYVRDGSIDLQRLFTKASVLQEVLQQQSFIKTNITAFKNLLRQTNMPAVKIGAHCSNPYPCDFTGHCWKDVPRDSVFELRGRGAKETALDLYGQGISRIADIPETYPLGNAQQMQVRSLQKDVVYINKDGLQQFINELSYPLYFVDFETFATAVPEHDGCWPYQQLPFQFSLHIVNDASKQSFAEKNVKHICFLAEHGGDPREAFLKNLVNNLGSKGSIVVYNQSFESGRLRELAELFPSYQKKITAIINRMSDLMVPFRKKDYYAPCMRGSYSIKEVLPALVPELSYDALPVNNGAAASDAFCRLKKETDATKIRETREQLLAYCKLDTWAMVKLVEKLKQLLKS